MKMKRGDHDQSASNMRGKMMFMKDELDHHQI
jgi:hypothetical protein